MKNIHLISTDKPSRFSLNSSGKYHLTNQLHTNSPNFTNHNINITNDEEIKNGNWYIYKEIPTKRMSINDCSNGNQFKKIILTTDIKLIEDGVQSIDDEFLEWFVKNPNCEEVETVFNNRGITGAEKILKTFGDYKIIIPKEEPKQERMYSEEEVLVLLHKRDAYNFKTNEKSLQEWGTPKEWLEKFKK